MLGRSASVLVAATLFVTACGGGDDATPATQAPAATDAPATAATTAEATTAPDEGGGATGVPAALDFQAPLVGGGEIELGALAGRPVLLWFWAPW